MKTVATIEARMSSTRLPGKVLLPIMGRPMLELLIERLMRAKTVDSVVVATTTNSVDDAIAALVERLGAGCFRGSEEDVLERVLRAAQSVGADLLVEITGDCPLVDPAIVDNLVEIYLHGDSDYVANMIERTFPDGLDVQVFPVSVLEEVERLTKDPVDREHVSLYIYEHPERFRLRNVQSGLPEKYWDARLTVDTREDFDLITRIYESLYPGKPDFSLADIIHLLETNPGLLDINRQITGKKIR